MKRGHELLHVLVDGADQREMALAAKRLEDDIKVGVRRGNRRNWRVSAGCNMGWGT
jgi:hypothetical protein